ncbi:alpha-carbonic anhydrase domain-containing protein [Nephila pilipes]|uniref:Alpha-carbonic anhydrase domain-containing protein n=1 Tax=Nephila pilipes TaxID=299642 RepID=A0A8X6P1D7_NEPPI|nr:alpha-carbonic anhydrase domain-containing protein [Nephila pilipes]
MTSVASRNSFCVPLCIYHFQHTKRKECKLGPDFWGLLNPEWSLCTKGRRQSPVDLDPEQILFDPYLRPLNISSHRVRCSV